MGTNDAHQAAPGHAVRGKSLIPLAMVADVKIVEGPAMIKSENGMLRNYVQLNVRDRDIVGFVEEAQRVVAQKVKLPQGMYLAWSGQFENQVRAGRRCWWCFPAVILVIFIILYLTYNDLIDAVLMMMAVPEAMVGGDLLFLSAVRPPITSAWPSRWASSPASAWPPRRASSCSCTSARRSRSAAGWRRSTRWRNFATP